MSATWLSRVARFGLACRGIVYLVIALLALNLARGRGQSGQPDTRGALETIARHPFGHALVLAIGVGFGCLAVWQAILAARAATGSGKRRLAAAGKAIIDAALCVSALAIAAHRQAGAGGDKQAVDVTGRVMAHAAGRYVVGAAGIVIGIAGLAMIVKGLRRRYDVEVHISDVPRSVRRTFAAIGGLGMLARGAIVGLLGYFVVEAAVTFNPAHAKGLDGVLASVLHDPWGPWLLSAIAVGLACFGLFSILEARYART
ncbi:MAG TPA: DUF1206 domain-containing protein [Acidimicrobiales bacterium]|nr:DUF1206 domain-containing protein [Acidimicrobiales bacterium]